MIGKKSERRKIRSDLIKILLYKLLDNANSNRYAPRTVSFNLVIQ